MVKLDYPKERYLRNGRPFSKNLTFVTGTASTVAEQTVAPSSNNYVLYIDRIYVDMEVEAATSWDLEIKSPEGSMFYASTTKTGIELVALINDPAKTVTSASTGLIYRGNIYLPSLIPAYYYQKGTTTASAGGTGCWSISVKTTTTDDGTDNYTAKFTFVGTECRKKKMADAGVITHP